VVAVRPGCDIDSIGLRVARVVLVRPCMRPAGFGSMENVWMDSDFDGAFAQFVVVAASEIFPVRCDWTDVELGSIPCAYGTAENTSARAGVKGGEHVLVAGASGGVGSAVVQLAELRGPRSRPLPGAQRWIGCGRSGRTIHRSR
jgi:NADPH:quinone reductase-like Zn-dependent oxidoreductase